MRRWPLLCFLLLACDNDPAEATVVNDVPNATIEKVWFRTTLFTQPLETGQTSEPLRIGTGAEPAYAVMKIGERRFLARTNDPVFADPAGVTRIVFSPQSARSLCFGTPRLDAADHDFV